jgi:hypothetical protein
LTSCRSGAQIAMCRSDFGYTCMNHRVMRPMLAHLRGLVPAIQRTVDGRVQLLS